VKATIYHNPACSTSRNTLAMLNETPGVAVEIVEYLKTPPSRETLQALYAAAGITPRQGMRTKGDLAGELGLLDPSVSDDAILDAMVANPALIERPLVRTDKGVRLCRPKEKLSEIL